MCAGAVWVLIGLLYVDGELGMPPPIRFETEARCEAAKALYPDLAHPNVEAYKLVCVETTATVFGGEMPGKKI